jgi:hypothetical protein
MRDIRLLFGRSIPLVMFNHGRLFLSRGGLLWVPKVSILCLAGQAKEEVVFI